MAKKKSDFIVETNGLCFLCLHKIFPRSHASNKSHLNPTDNVNPIQNHSIQYLSRYLKMDMTILFIGDGPTSPQLLDNVRKSNLKVKLCDECLSINAKFSKLGLQLEKIKMEMKSCLQLISVKLNRKSELGKGEESGMLSGTLNMLIFQVMEQMRREANQKCSKKVHKSKLLPKVRLQNFSKQHIHGIKQKLKSSRNQRSIRSQQQNIYDTSQESIPILEAQPIVKLEPDTVNPLSEWDYDDGDSNFHGDDQSGPPPSATKQVFSVALPKSRKESRGSVMEKCMIDSHTGKYVCSNCSKEYSTPSGFLIHYKTEHLNIRYSCSVCDKAFKKTSQLNSHQNITHKGTNFRCPKCNQSFPLESKLLKHKRSNACMNREKVHSSNLTIVRPSIPSTYEQKTSTMCSLNPNNGKYLCKLCPRELASIFSFRTHYSDCHLKIKYRCNRCLKEFSNICNYYKHHKRFHIPNSKGNLHKCMDCNKSFRFASRLKFHKKAGCARQS